MSNFCPKVLEVTKIDPYPGRFELQGLNERFRLCRYDVGQSFKKHCDGSFNRGHKYWSFLTLMVYLNDEFTGGKTIFYDKSNQVTHEIRPKTGLAIVFFQTSKYPHIGEEIQTGRKYILRTDIMYKCTEDRSQRVDWSATFQEFNK